jgi:parallel beta-helix repeat protein
MHKKILLCVGITILFLGTCITPSVAIDTVKKSYMPIFNGNTLYVGGTGEDNYTKIQDAIDNASDFDTVFVYNGIYYENVEINKYGITLIGEYFQHTIIDGGGIKSVILIVENNYDVTVSGFTIRNAGSNIWHDAGIEIQSGFNYITNNLIRNNPQHGVIINNRYDSMYNDISYNMFMNNSQGITLDYAMGNWLNNNIIISSGIGVFVGTSSLPSEGVWSSLNWELLTLWDEENYVYGNHIWNNDKGVVIEPWANTHVFNNTIIENDLGVLLSAPYATGCRNNYIYQNNIINNSIGMNLKQAIGGRLSSVYNNEIHHNNFIDNDENVFGNGNNIWKENYWDDWIGLKFRILRFLPYRIKGTLLKNIDWRPAKEPYDIEV